MNNNLNTREMGQPLQPDQVVILTHRIHGPITGTVKSLQRLQKSFIVSNTAGLIVNIKPSGHFEHPGTQAKFEEWLSEKLVATDLDSKTHPLMFSASEAGQFVLGYAKREEGPIDTSMMQQNYTIPKRPIKNGMPPIHPGTVLKEMFLDEMKMSIVDFAKHIHTSPCVVSDIVNGKRSVEAFSAMLFAKALGTTVEFWMNLQNTFDIRTVEVRNPGFPSFVEPINNKG
jgi:addiction module HigA family antidote